MNNYYFPRLKDLREDEDLSQEEIARVINTTQQYYGQYEKGARPIPFDRAVKIAEFYSVSLDYIAGLTNDKRGIGFKESKYNISQNGSFNKQTIKIKE